MSLKRSGDTVKGVIHFVDNACIDDSAVEGTVDGDQVELRVTRGDEVVLIGTLTTGAMAGTFTIGCDHSSGTWQVARAG